MERSRTAPERWWWPAVVALTALAFALRLIGLRESPAGDELIFHWYVDGRSFGSMWQLIVDHEKTPPLGFVLGWLSAHLGTASTWMRLPSLIAGTATVPIVGLLGRRCGNSVTGVIAAAFAATSPFLLFYGIESRAYGLAACLSCASILLLIAATDRGGFWRWAGWSVTAAGAVMSHYTAVFVVLTAFVWALVARPRSRRALIAPAAGALLLAAWWIPSFITQWGHSGSEARRIGNLAPLALSTLQNITARALVGHPLWSSLQTTATSSVPGTPALVMILTGLGIALLFTLTDLIRARSLPRPSPEGLLIAGCALATPVGLVLLSLEPGKTLLLPRNLICSVPPAAVLFALPISHRRAPVAAACAALVSAGLLVGSVRELTDYTRPPMRSAAEAVAGRWTPGDTILEAIYFREPPLDQDLAIHLTSAQRASLQLTSKVALLPFDGPHKAGTSVFTVAPIYGYTVEALGPRPDQAARWELVWQKRWPGLPPVVAAQWRLRAEPRHSGR